MDEQSLRKIAETLYSGYHKDTTGTAAKLKDADPGTRKIWVRTAKRAVTVVLGSTPRAAKTAAASPDSGARPS